MVVREDIDEAVRLSGNAASRILAELADVRADARTDEQDAARSDAAADRLTAWAESQRHEADTLRHCAAGHRAREAALLDDLAKLEAEKSSLPEPTTSVAPICPTCRQSMVWLSDDNQCWHCPDHGNGTFYDLYESRYFGRSVPYSLITSITLNDQGQQVWECEIIRMEVGRGTSEITLQSEEREHEADVVLAALGWIGRQHDNDTSEDQS